MRDYYLSDLPKPQRKLALSWRAKQFALTLHAVRVAAEEKKKKNWKVRNTL